jgi:hypothetical protein
MKSQRKRAKRWQAFREKLARRRRRARQNGVIPMPV